jgi:HD-like signal output (HDOD) protein
MPMQSETLETIRRSASIPSVPMVATRCYEMTQDSNCDYNKLVELLSTDPGIASSLLRLANSPLFGVAGRVSSLRHAIALLGVTRIRQLVQARYLVQQTEELGCEKINIDYYWRLSVTTAILAAGFADALCPRQRDAAFVGGLLADLGVLVLARSLPSQYDAIAMRYQPHETDDWIILEKQRLDVTHGEVSAMVLEQWRLPNVIVEAVRFHHAGAAEIPADCEGSLLARIIGGAGGVARILSQTSNVDSAVEKCTAAMTSVDLDMSTLIQTLEGIEEQIARVADLLQIDVLSSKVFTLICSQLIENLETRMVTSPD